MKGFLSKMLYIHSVVLIVISVTTYVQVSIAKSEDEIKLWSLMIVLAVLELILLLLYQYFLKKKRRRPSK